MAYDIQSAAFAEALRKLAAEDPAVADAIADREQVNKYSGDYDQEWQDPYATGRLYGREGNEAWAYYDPATDSYQRVAADEKADLDKMYAYQNIHGDSVWGLKPEDGWHNVDLNGESSLGQGSIDPRWANQPQLSGPDTGTPVPSSPIDNPNYDPNLSPFQPGDGTGWFGDPGSAGGGGPGSAGGGQGGTANTSWDWAGRGTQGVQGPAMMEGYDLTYGPGQDSPWGMGGEGGNQEFYAQQFNNLLREGQQHKNQQIAAAIRAEHASNQPVPEMGDPFAWANQGQGLREGSPWPSNEGFQSAPTQVGTQPTGQAPQQGWAPTTSTNPAQLPANLGLGLAI